MNRRAKRLLNDLDQEIHEHIELVTQENIDRGMAPEEARYAASRKFGNVTRVKEDARDVWIIVWAEQLRQDIGFALRQLRKSPVFTSVAILTLALGIGANTVIFSMVNALLLHPYRFHDLDSLMLIWENRGIDEGFDSRWISAGDTSDLTKDTQLFQEVAQLDCRQFNLSNEGRIDVVQGCRVSTNFFHLLGVRPAQGRTFSQDEDRVGSNQVAVVSDAFWQSRFAGDSGFLGKTIRLSGQSYTVVGIMPRGFSYPTPRELWVPLALNPTERADRSQVSLAALGRLRDNVTLQRAQGELAGLSRRLADSFPATNSGRVFGVLQLRKELYLYALPLFLLLQAGAVFLLLLTCANLANLVLARTMSRQRDLAVRSCLGASTLRLSRLLTSELLLLALLGGAVAIVASFWGVRALRDSISPEWTKWVPGWNGIGVDGSVLAFAILLSAAIALLFGFATSVYMLRVDLNRVLKETGRVATASRWHLRNALVCAQVTLALVLLVGAGLTMQGFHRLVAVYQGFQPDHVLKFEVGLPDNSYPDNSRAASFFQRALLSVSNLPGVSEAALASNLPASNVETEKTLFTIEGRSAPSASETPEASLQVISGAYFSVLKTPIIAGRFLSDSDDDRAARVFMINQSMASHFWPAGDALGKRIKLGPPDSPDRWTTIVGIVGDTRQNWWQSATLPVIYQPYLQASRRTLEFVMRVGGTPAGFASSVSSLFSQLDPEIAVTDMNTLQGEVDDSIAIVHMVGTLMAIFGIVALLLSLVGLYGILSENVGQRTKEFGVRLALGAQPGEVLRLVLRRALTLIGIGIALGLPLAFLVGKTMAALVFGVVSVSLSLLTELAASLVLVAISAAYLPARRASLTDLMTALRYE